MPRRPLALPLLAAGCVVTAAVTWLLAFHTSLGGRVDRALLDALASLRGTPVEPLAALGADLAGPVPFTLLAIALVAIAAKRGGRRLTLAVAAILGGASLTTQILKPIATVPRPVAPPADILVGNAWPSGHTTAAVALALCLLIVAPPLWRPLAIAAGALFALAEGFGLVVMSWHYPSDVLAGAAVATAWAALGVAALRATPARGPRRAARRARRPGPAVPER
jgi:membrane-associated phospholipid phosphatase